MKVIILAGGKGKRLEPYTTILPKPLMPINDMPIAEVIIRQLCRQGFKDIIFAVGHLSNLLKLYFGDGKKLGVKIAYSEEKKPLGTMGPLKQILKPSETFLVMNGDVLTTLDYNKLLEYHKQKKASMTVAMNCRQVHIDFGIPKINEKNEITDYEEKPTLEYFVSMGIYVLEPKLLDYIIPGKKIDLPDFVRLILRKKEKVCGYISKDYWLDIGRFDDYQKAQIDFKKNFKGKF